ncbi:MAG: hypothetical protein ACOC1U_06410, partial [Spirochaetota bacterium]
THDSVYLGEADVVLEDDESVSVIPSQLIALIEDALLPRVVNDARAVFSSDRPVAPEAFATLGITVRFDWESLALDLSIPPLILRPQRIAFSSVARERTGRVVEPAPFSLIANLDLWSRYSWETAGFEASATPELAANLSGVALEAQGGVRTGGDPFFLDHVRLTYDIPELGYRAEAGDLTWRTTELAGVTGVTGLSLFREESVPARGFPEDEPNGERTMPEAAPDVLHSFYLAEGSEVRVTLNENELYRRDLPPGNYEVTGLLLGDGLNTVVISWEVDGEVREVEIVLPYDTRLLDAGTLDAGVAMGVANRSVVRPLIVSYQRYGLTPWLTLGLREGVEMLDFQLDAGAEITMATPIGTISLEPSFALGPLARFLVDVPLRYSFLDTSPSSYLNFGVSASYRSLTAADASTAEQAVSGSAYVSFALPEGFSVTPRVSHRYSIADATHRFEARGSLRKSIRGGSALSAEVGFVWDGAPSFLATVSYSAAFPDLQQNLLVQQNLNSQELFAYWSRYPGSAARDLDYSITARVPIDTAEISSLSARVGYNDPAFRAQVGHTLTGAPASGVVRNASTLALRSALVTAGGLFAVSRPVADSFALVVPGTSLESVPLVVDRRGGVSGIAVSGGAGVVGGLRAWTPANVDVETQEMVLGLDESDLQYLVTPTYRSGTVIVVETPPNIFAGGTLVDRAGKPIAFALGAWTGPGDSSGEFFTDADGYFELYGLTVGEYELIVPARPELRFALTIPEGAREFVDLGELRGEE